jgi:hypothetical protein
MLFLFCILQVYWICSFTQMGFEVKYLRMCVCVHMCVRACVCVCVCVCVKSCCLQTDNLISSFPVWIPIICLACLIAVARTSSTMLKRSCVGILVLFQILEEKLLFPSIQLMLATELSYVTITVLGYVLSILNLLRIFIKMLNFIKCFLCVC